MAEQFTVRARFAGEETERALQARSADTTLFALLDFMYFDWVEAHHPEWREPVVVDGQQFGIAIRRPREEEEPAFRVRQDGTGPEMSHRTHRDVRLGDLGITAETVFEVIPTE